MSSLQFAWPWVFLIAPLPLLVQHRKKRSSTQTAIDIPYRLQLALEQLTPQTQQLRLSQYWVPWLAWLLLLCALAQPSIALDVKAPVASGRAITLVIDLSDSMERQDFKLDQLTADRLTVVKQAATQFIEHRQGDRIGLVLFGAEAYIGAPLSFDLHSVVAILNAAGIGMAGRSTAIGDALGLAIQTLRHDSAHDKAIVLLSDGTNNSGSVEPESAATLANSLGIRVHTIALGSDQAASGFQTAASADLDEETLKSIAQEAQGTFFRARSSQDLNSIYQSIDKMEKAETAAPEVILQKDIRNAFLIALLLLLCVSEAHQQIGTRIQTKRHST